MKLKKCMFYPVSETKVSFNIRFKIS